MGAEKDELWDWNRCACHCLNIAVQAALKETTDRGLFLAPLTTLGLFATQILQEPECMESVQEDAAGNIELGGARSNDEREADFDGDEDFEVGGEGHPRLKKVL